MFTKKQRLTKKEFEYVFKNGKRIHSPVVQLIYTPTDEFHCSAVVGKKIYKKAVDRNRLRRRMYAVAYKSFKNVVKNGSFILVAKPALREVPKSDFSDDITTVLKKAVL